LVLTAAALYLPHRNKTRAMEESEPKTPVSTTSPAGPAPSTPMPDTAGAGPASVEPAAASTPVGGTAAATNTGSVAERPSSGVSSSAPLAAGTGKSLARTSSGQSNSDTQGHAQSQDAGSNAPAPPVDRAVLEALEQEQDQLSSRVVSVNSGLNNLRRSQEAQGYGLRGDIVAAQERMQSNMAKAQSALQDRDASRAKRYLDLTETEVGNLEKFLGR